MGKIYAKSESWEENMKTKGISQAQLLNEARQAAGSFSARESRKRQKKSRTGIIVAVSALSGTGIAYAIMKLVEMFY